jgi:hypothetical protein
MTLLVHRCQWSGEKWDIIDEPDHAKELAGFETWRSKVWGSAAVIALGCRILPQLRTQDIYCLEQDVPHLTQDAKLILKHLADIAEATGCEAETIRYRTQNILDAALWAQEHPHGGVIIW